MAFEKKLLLEQQQTVTTQTNNKYIDTTLYWQEEKIKYLRKIHEMNKKTQALNNQQAIQHSVNNSNKNKNNRNEMLIKLKMNKINN